MNIIIVENDYLQYDWMKDIFARRFPYYHISQIKTELEFCNQLKKIAAKPPDVIIMDVMLQWTTPSENVERPPDEVKEGGHHTAGLRCQERLRSDEKTKDIPVILYTVLEQPDLERRFGGTIPEHIRHLRKESDPEPLFSLIQEVTAHPRQ
ncbi:MAG TPA: hypothetical protein VE863_19745 [Pyrinomonadaceae bacterium]|nr:hypothetical protein [Pyrinomonadaceae bacterium]